MKIKVLELIERHNPLKRGTGMSWDPDEECA